MATEILNGENITLFSSASWYSLFIRSIENSRIPLVIWNIEFYRIWNHRCFIHGWIENFQDRPEDPCMHGWFVRPLSEVWVNWEGVFWLAISEFFQIEIFFITREYKTQFYAPKIGCKMTHLSTQIWIF